MIFRSHVQVICCREITYYNVKKGANFTTTVEKQETDLTADMINRSVKMLFHSAFLSGSSELCCYCLSVHAICFVSFYVTVAIGPSLKSSGG